MTLFGLISDLFLVHADICNVFLKEHLSLNSAVSYFVADADGVQEYPSPYSVHEYILWHISAINAQRLLLISAGRTFTNARAVARLVRRAIRDGSTIANTCRLS